MKWHGCLICGPITFHHGAITIGLDAGPQPGIEQFTGTVFVFRAKRADRLKLLYWDGTGFVLAYKRPEETTFTWPAMTACEVARHRRVWPLLRRRGVLANMQMTF